ncbi:MAG: diacylglycerol kinase family lipid kinase, partial [Clostridia bacterium]|nr:diacylglycerol kinase family lipid kinase [Clostridia bacterium]
RKIIGGKATAVDIGKGNGEYFSYVAGFGAFTEVSYETPQNAKNALGKAAYFFMGAKSLANIKPYKMTVKWDGKEERGEFILGLITNVDHVAGMKTKYNENTQINDGLFEVILVRKPKTLAQLSLMTAEMMSNKLSEENFLKFSAKDMSFVCDEKVKWTFDGEFGGETDNMEISVMEKAIDIIL